MREFVIAVLFSAALYAAGPELNRARDLYQRTQYQESLQVLAPIAKKDPAAQQLMGQDYYMLADYKRATDAFDRALAMGNDSEELMVWAGRAYGRRAETSSVFRQPGLAQKARKFFEQAVQMNIRDREATGDLFDYYMGAPGFMGGGTGKAQDLASRVAAVDPPEGQHLYALLSEKNKEYDAAEKHLRQAVALAPKQASRVMELARFLARRGRTNESDTLFEQATKLAPENHSILFYRAQTYIEGNRNVPQAKVLLEQYLKSPLTPDDPPRQKAQELLSKASAE